MKSVIGVDPGSKQSAFVWWNGKEILEKGLHPNEELIPILCHKWNTNREPITLAIESMVHIHVPKTGKLKGAGKDICDTLRWEGQFYRAWLGDREFVPGHIIRKALGAKNDKEIRMVLIQRFGVELTSGLKGKGYHLWRAFAVCVYYMDHLNFQERILKG